ncbi:uncharacterized protein PV07_10556 [Cladophialophora immunda]|uniref:Beta-lactamase-related domain-containing protein n=1 Tax=Cladophialophora immunda TaxID=569365 RepID=A0A0D2CMS9_9EURO|nr:uncharacterized protein PV07_10556 [Cladophialophora immunda]KIW24869.1 hypothetical protein PV07_10556 [Cladophialophora immunda]
MANFQAPLSSSESRMKQAVHLRPQTKSPTALELTVAHLTPMSPSSKTHTLLSHTSGFGYDVWDPALIKWRQSTGTTINANSFSVESLKIPLKLQSGEDWLYGIGFDWAGYVVEWLTQLYLEEYMQSNIFKPLGMTRTTFHIARAPRTRASKSEYWFLRSAS